MAKTNDKPNNNEPKKTNLSWDRPKTPSTKNNLPRASNVPPPPPKKK